MSAQRGGSGSGGESDVDRGHGGKSKIDWAWEHCQALDAVRQKTQCNYCDKKMSGGISRFKHHIIGGDKNVVRCGKVPDEVRQHFKERSSHKQQKKYDEFQVKQKMKEAMFGTRREVVDLDDDSDDDDIAYPVDMDSPRERRAYRMAMKDSIQLARERQHGGIHSFFGGQGTSGAGGSGPRLTSPTTERIRSQSTRFTSSEPAFRKSSAKQKTIKGFWKNAKELVGAACSKFVFAHGIAPNVASGPYLQNVIDVCAEYGRGTDAPTPHEIMNKYLPAEKEEIDEWIEAQKKNTWGQFGVTLMCDGWTSGTKQQIINFLVYCDGITYYLKSVDASAYVKNHTYLAKLMESVIAEVGKENIVQIVTDNGANFKKAGLAVESSSKYNLYWTPCAAHCIDLILKDFGKCKLFEYVMPKARRITNFIYNRSYLLAMMRSKEYCGGDLVRPGLTRFASNYIALQSLKDKKQGLLRMFSSEKWGQHSESQTQAAHEVKKVIYDDTFWNKLSKAIKIMCPIVHVLRMVDGDKKPTMPYVYEGMRLMRERVEEAAGRKSCKQYLDIIDARWDGMLSLPLHKAAYYLNPRFQYSQNLGMKGDLQAALHRVIEKLSPDNDKALYAMSQIKHFREASGVFGIRSAIYGRDKMAPAEWWAEFGTDCEELRAIAVRVLSQTAAAGGCERNWSTFNLIHTKRRNRLGAKKLHMLVYVHYNIRLKEKHLHDKFSKPTSAFGASEDPLDWAYIYYNNDEDDDPLQAWLNDEAPLLDVGASGAAPDPMIAEQMGIDVNRYNAEEGNLSNVAHGRLEPGRDDPGDFFVPMPGPAAGAGQREASSDSTPEPSGGGRHGSDSDDDASTPSGGGSHIRGNTPPARSPPPTYQPPGGGDVSHKRSGKEADLPPRPSGLKQYQKKGKNKNNTTGQKFDDTQLPPYVSQPGYGSYGSYGTSYESYDYGSYGQPQGPTQADDLAESIASWHISSQAPTGPGHHSTPSFMDDLFGYSVAPSHQSYGHYGQGSGTGTPSASSVLGQFGSHTSSASGTGSYGLSMDSTAHYPFRNYYEEGPTISDESDIPAVPSISRSQSIHASSRLDSYERFGFLASLSDSDFAAHVDEYERNYNEQMTWMQYAFRLDNMMASRSQFGERHSSWY